jgi:uncharacterized sodium:solute symporter family permease YidK
VVVLVLGAITFLKPMAKPVVLPTTDLIKLESSRSAKIIGIAIVILTLCLYAIFW